MTTEAGRAGGGAAEFGGGARDVMPIVAGAVPFGMLFGALAAQADFGTGPTLLMSLIVYSGTMQVIGLNMIGASTPWPLIAFASFIVNFRHVLYSAALTAYLRRLPVWWRVLLSYGMTDQIYALAEHRYSARDDSTTKHWYVLGSSSVLFVAWLGSTYAGLRFGDALSSVEGIGLDFAFYATLVALVAPVFDNSRIVLAGLSAGLIAVPLATIPYQGGVFIAIVLGILIGVASERWIHVQSDKKAGKATAATTATH